MQIQNDKKFIYILRYAVQPGYYEDERLDNLLTFCNQAKIDDVMFFINCEELNNGHITKEEAIPWMGLISKAKSELDKYGITTSINPWTTTLHADRGRVLKEGQNFNLMVDPFGNQSTAVACPMCNEWQQYITELYSYFVSIKPNMIWVEDDFRFHNHAPLKWGGCFCEAHMEEFSKRAGKKLGREEFLSGVLKPGEPHPYRKIWLDTARENLVKVAGMIGDAVHKVSPETRVGLMSSYPSVHCAEGRDWTGILKGLSGENTQMVIRPHLPAYTGDTGQQYIWNFNGASKMTAASIPEATEIYPELESCPDTRFTKSNKFTQYQIETSVLINSAGITLNIFDMMGNGVLLSEGYQNILAESKKFLTAINNLELKSWDQKGVKVLFSSESSYNIHTSNGNHMEELYPAESFWASMLTAYGISNTFSTDKSIKNSIVAVSGQYFRNLNEDELRQLFANNFVMMEADAAYTLLEMGFGELAGISNAKWHLQDTGYQSYEQVAGDKVYNGISGARMSASCVAGDYLEIEYMKEPSLLTKMMNYSGKPVGAGMVLYENRVFILPYGKTCGRTQAHLNVTKQAIIQSILQGLKNYESPAFIIDAPYVSVDLYENKGKKALVVVNSSDDDLEKIIFSAHISDKSTIFELNRQNTKPVLTKFDYDADELVINSGIKSKELKIFLVE